MYAIHDARRQASERTTRLEEECQGLKDSVEEMEMRVNMEKKGKQQSLAQVGTYPSTECM